MVVGRFEGHPLKAAMAGSLRLGSRVRPKAGARDEATECRGLAGSGLICALGRTSVSAGSKWDFSIAVV